MSSNQPPLVTSPGVSSSATSTPEPQNANRFSNRLDIRHILTHRPPTLDYVLPGLLASSTGLIVGPGGVGKTMLELQIALGIASGESICGGLFESAPSGVALEPEAAKVVLVVAEESLGVIWQRLHAIVSTLVSDARMGCNHCNPDAMLELWHANLHIHALAGMGPVPLMGKGFERTAHFHDLQRVCEGARLVILDPLRQFHQCEENDSAAMTCLAQHMQSIATSAVSAVLGAHHTNRASGALGFGDTAGASRGSSALTDAVRWQLNLSAPTKDGAKYHGIAEQERKNHLLVDLPKANYVAPQKTRVLQRLDHGVLVCVDEGGFDAQTPNGKTYRRKP
jgi:RecA-family ATPase